MMTKNISRQERMIGSLWASLAGDALGVPVEFQSRETVRRHPVTGMRGFGTHNQPAGTWSDDSSLLLCSAESLAECRAFNSADMGERFARWKTQAHWTPHQSVFDIGIATSQALSRIASGTPAELAGGADEYSNGNGSLMRILPVTLWFASAPTATLLDAVHRASSITHRHPRSQMACGLYALLVRELLAGLAPEEAYHRALICFAEVYQGAPYTAERLHFQQLGAEHISSLPDSSIGSSGYVLDTLTASIWCLLTTNSLREAVLKAVNLGSDTDTTGCVAGGLTGLWYGPSAIPSDWLNPLARRQDVEELFGRFTDSVPLCT